MPSARGQPQAPWLPMAATGAMAATGDTVPTTGDTVPATGDTVPATGGKPDKPWVQSNEDKGSS